QLSLNALTQRANSLQPIQTNVTWQAIAAGYTYTLAIRADGTLWTWGTDGRGELGNGMFYIYTNTPQSVQPGLTWQSIAAGGGHSLALRPDGTLWTWGYNSNGQLGNGSNGSTNTPQAIQTNVTWQAIAAGGSHTVALRADGTLW